MGKRILMVLVLGVFGATLTGCATTRLKQNELELQGLKNQVAALESQLQSKDEEINGLKDSLNQVQNEAMAQSQGKESSDVSTGSIKHPKTKQIQIALKNAGYFSGTATGRMGKVTRAAIRSFQRANGLGVDGKVGPKTWAKLSEYLEKKAK